MEVEHKLKYTICFIKRGDKILLLNRESPTWMGMWNGVGGKLEKNESPLQCILREVKEETGISLHTAEYKGNVMWENIDQSYVGGMYTYMVELPKEYKYNTPIKVDEGILDWKKINWILHPENTGVANLQYFLSSLLDEKAVKTHHFTYENDEVKDFQSYVMEDSVR